MRKFLHALGASATLIGLTACGDGSTAGAVSAATTAGTGGSSTTTPATAVSTTTVAADTTASRTGITSSSSTVDVTAASPASTSTTTTSTTTGSTGTVGSVVTTATNTVTTATNAVKPIMLAAASGFTEMRIKTATSSPTPSKDNVGAFRNTCGYSHFAFDDPIVFPGQFGASHLHVFVGNTGTNAASTSESLATSGGSTCTGGIANRSAYWQPAMINTTTNTAVAPDWTMIYYKSGYVDVAPESVKPMPNGLRMIAGNKVTNSGPIDPAWTVTYHFHCDGPNGVTNGQSQSIPDCPVGTSLFAIVDFPDCWDGVNLDSPDHRSHMAYAYLSPGYKCPASHPVPIPVLTLNFRYDVKAGQSTKNWRLSSDGYSTSIPGGYTMHADAWIAWDEGVKQTWIDKCVRTAMDCNFILGDGRELY